ncbi:MAG: tripartite tricarboxylate transporter TctB family protein [Aquabacterium sp.]|nr:tripartite tricarboxylate transporter TctB family protein [Aquabacterium sp.]
MRAIDLRVGVALALLAAAVLWSAQAFPVVPGQQLGAGFLPKLVGTGLLLCGLGLVVRSLRGVAYDDPVAASSSSWRDIASALLILATIAAYIALADRLGFLLIAPLCLLAVFRVLRVGWGPAIGFALGGTLLVHLAFYKLLRVPLPWGVLSPLY